MRRFLMTLALPLFLTAPALAAGPLTFQVSRDPNYPRFSFYLSSNSTEAGCYYTAGTVPVIPTSRKASRAILRAAEGQPTATQIQCARAEAWRDLDNRCWVYDAKRCAPIP